MKLCSYALCATLALAMFPLAVAQNTAPKAAPKTTAKTPAAKPAATTRAECSAEAEFCVNVPAAWQRLGDDEGAGFVVAEPKAGLPQEQWPLLTTGAVELPDVPEGKEPPTLDEFVTGELMNVGKQFTIVASERSRREVGGHDAQTVRLVEQDAATKEAAVELLGFLDGDDDVIYMISLRCAQSEEERLTPVFERILRSWRSTTRAAAPKPAAGAAKPTNK